MTSWSLRSDVLVHFSIEMQKKKVEIDSESSSICWWFGPNLMLRYCAYKGAANYMTPAFAYASLPHSLQSQGAAASLPLSHYTTQSQLQEARMQ